MRLNITLALLGCFCLVQLVQASFFKQTFSAILFTVLASLPTVSPPHTFVVGRNDTFSVLRPTATIKLATPTTEEFLRAFELRANCLPLAPVPLLPEKTSMTHEIQEYGPSLLGQAHVPISESQPYNVSLINATGLLLDTTALDNLGYHGNTEICPLSVYGTTRGMFFRWSEKLSRIGEVAASIILRIFACIDAAQAATALSFHSTTSATIRAVLPLVNDLHTSFTTLWKSKTFRYIASALLVVGAKAVALAWVKQGNFYGREGSWLRNSTNCAQTLVYLLCLSVNAVAMLPIQMFRETGIIRLAIGLLIVRINLVYSWLCQVSAFAWISLICACCLGIDLICVALSFTEMIMSNIIAVKLACLSAVAMLVVYFLWPWRSFICGCFHRIFVVSKKFCNVCVEARDCARKLYISVRSYTREDHHDSASFNPPSASLDGCDSKNECPLPSGRPANDYQTWDLPNRPYKIPQSQSPCNKLFPLRRTSLHNAYDPRRIAVVSRLPPSLQNHLSWKAIQVRKKSFTRFARPSIIELPPIPALPAPDHDPRTPPEAVPTADDNNRLSLPNKDIGSVSQPVVSDSATGLLADSVAVDPTVDGQLTIPSTSIQNAPTPLQASNPTVSPITITATMTPLPQLMEYKHTGSAENLLDRFDYEPTGPATVLPTPDASPADYDEMLVDQDASVDDEVSVLTCELSELSIDDTASTAHLPSSNVTCPPFPAAPYLPPGGNTLQQTPFQPSAAGGFPSNSYPSSNQILPSPVVGSQLSNDVEMGMDLVPAPTLSSFSGASSFITQPSSFITQPSSFITQPSSFITQPSSFITQPSSFITQPSPFITQPSSFTTQPSPFTTQPSSFTTQPSSFTAQPSSFITQPSSFMTQPSSFTAQPSSFMTQPSSFITQTSSFITQPSPFASGFMTQPAPSQPASFLTSASSNGPNTTFSHFQASSTAPSSSTGMPGLGYLQKDNGPLLPSNNAIAPPAGPFEVVLCNLPTGTTANAIIPLVKKVSRNRFPFTVKSVRDEGRQIHVVLANETVASFVHGNFDKMSHSDVARKLGKAVGGINTGVDTKPVQVYWKGAPAPGTTPGLYHGIHVGEIPTTVPKAQVDVSGTDLDTQKDSTQHSSQSLNGTAGALGSGSSTLKPALSNIPPPLASSHIPLSSTGTTMLPLPQTSSWQQSPFSQSAPAVAPQPQPSRSQTFDDVNMQDTAAQTTKVGSNSKAPGQPPNLPLSRQHPPTTSSPLTPSASGQPRAQPFTGGAGAPGVPQPVLGQANKQSQLPTQNTPTSLGSTWSIPLLPPSGRFSKPSPAVNSLSKLTSNGANSNSSKVVSNPAKTKNSDHGITSQISDQDKVQQKISQPAVNPAPAIKLTLKNLPKKSTSSADSVQANDKAPTFKTEGTSRYSQVAVSAFDPDLDEDDALAWADEITPGKRVAGCHIEDGEDGCVAVFSFITKVHADQFKMAVNAQPGPYPKPRALSRELASAQPAAAQSTPSTPLSEPKPAIVERPRTKAHVVEISNMDDSDEEKQKRHLVEAIARLNTEHAEPYLARRSGENGTIVMRLEFDSEIIAYAIVQHLEGHFFAGTNWGAELLKQRPVFRQLKVPKRAHKKV